MTGEVHLSDGTVMKTDSLRVDMDGGRIILSEEKSTMYETNKRNWIQELIFYKNKKKLSTKILNDIKKELKHLEKESGNKFGDLKKPLLVSVRSGARM